MTTASRIGLESDDEVRVIVTGALDWGNEIKLRNHDWRATDALDNILDEVAKRAAGPGGENRLVLHVRAVGRPSRTDGLEPDAKTAEEAAIAWAADRGVECVPYSADWRPTEIGGEGREAGMNRNYRMLEEGLPHLVVHFPTRLAAPGPEHLLRTAQAKGVPIEVGTMRGKCYPITEAKTKDYDPGDRYWESEDEPREQTTRPFIGAEELLSGTGVADASPEPPAEARPTTAAAPAPTAARRPKNGEIRGGAAFIGAAELLASVMDDKPRDKPEAGTAEPEKPTARAAVETKPRLRPAGGPGANGGPGGAEIPKPNRGAGLDAGGTHPAASAAGRRRAPGTQTPGS